MGIRKIVPRVTMISHPGVRVGVVVSVLLELDVSSKKKSDKSDPSSKVIIPEVNSIFSKAPVFLSQANSITHGVVDPRSVSIASIP